MWNEVLEKGVAAAVAGSGTISRRDRTASTLQNDATQVKSQCQSQKGLYKAKV